MSRYIVRACAYAAVLFSVGFSFVAAEITNRGECTFGSGTALVRTPFEIIFPRDERIDLRNFTTYNAASYRRPAQGIWPLWYECDATAASLPLSARPLRLKLSHRDETNQSEPYAKTEIVIPANCGLSESSRTRLIGVSECKTLRNPTQQIRYQDFAAAQDAYARACSGADAQPSDSETCKALQRTVNEKKPEFKAVCFDYATERGGDRAHQQELLKHMYKSCGLTLGAETTSCGPESERRLNNQGSCACVDQRKRWDERSNRCVTLTEEQCRELGREWSSNTCQNLCRNAQHGLIRSTDSSGDATFKCDVCPAGQEKDAAGFCVIRTTTHPRTPEACSQANGVWHTDGPGGCEVCSPDKMPGAQGCVPRQAFRPAELPHCASGTFTQSEQCKCNAGQEKVQANGVFACAAPAGTRRQPGSACVIQGTQQEGVIQQDGETCGVVRVVQCREQCNQQTQQCQNGQCVPRVQQPPAQTPPQQCTGGQCSRNTSQNAPQGQQNNFTKGLEKGLTRGLLQQMTPQEQARQQAQQAQQAAEQARQQALQQQQDPYLMQRLMQMFQQQPFTNTFANQPVTQASCDSFDIDLPETQSGLFRAEKGKPIEVSWSVTDAKRVTVDTTPRSTTRYDRDSGSSATVIPSRSGTLTIRLKIDSNLYTKEPCRAKKVRVR